MTLVLDLPPDVEARLDAQAAELGVEPSEYALQILQAGLPASNVAVEAASNVSDSPDTNLSMNPTVALLQEWRAEWEAMTPEEQAEAEAELEELKAALNANRAAAGARLLFP